MPKFDYKQHLREEDEKRKKGGKLEHSTGRNVLVKARWERPASEQMNQHVKEHLIALHALV